MKPFVFTLMPFDKSYDNIYQLGIKATCEKLETYCERVDEQIYQESIYARIVNQIAKADIVIGDMSDQNPNVFFEIGYANALEKKIIYLTSKSTDIPFDLKHFRHIIYDKNDISQLKQRLEKDLVFYLDNLGKSADELKFGLNLYILGQLLAEEQVTEIFLAKNVDQIPLTIENISGKVIPEESMQISLHGNLKDHFPNLQEPLKRVFVDSKMNVGFSVNNLTPHFNEAHETYILCKIPQTNIDDITLHLSIYTNNGKRNYTINFKVKNA
ncbi:nucleoside 2-deoxyribosyltransferase [Nitrosomonas oligotropha]|uniref:Nucleoside 2-deoxyribosyltransferase n=1 Tax=Nitrosomonas oligotropha TaxID=42354 RepID=A0A1H8MTZ8_9PROT|nr:nucleoside 2-deoxyribosyltransferase [Nitrosomonas oligotropha]SDW52746.1 Nucleoside 2-deoxyribosyltransferase [Nitrosomonas oligotropha]SEO20892.1 Nucleoside 2-deoxyribosyltransferase [Nitrosomonas oligotropha]